MDMKGRLETYYNDSIVTSRTFDSPKHRERVIDNLKHIYGKLFPKFQIKDVLTNSVAKMKRLAEDVEDSVIPKKSNFKKGSLPKTYKIKRVREVGLRESEN